MIILKRLYKPEYFNRPGRILDRAVFSFFPPKNCMQAMRLIWGSSIIANPHQTIGKSLYTFGLYDLPLSEIIYRIVRPHDLVVDVGANVGYTSKLMLDCLQGEGELISFEPIESLFKILEENVYKKENEKIKLMQVALSDEDGKATIVIPKTFYLNDGVATMNKNAEGEKLQIDTMKFDSLILNRPVRLMKIDVEGHELNVLKGAENYIDKGYIENIIFEDLRGDGGEVAQFLLGKGFSVFKIMKGFRGPKLGMLNQHNKYSYEPDNFWATKDRNLVEECQKQKKWGIFNWKITDAD